MKRILVCAISLLFLAPANASDSLTVRNAHAMIYHKVRGTVLLLGGADERSVRGDLWEWNGKHWRLVAREGPPPRTFPAMAYDRARARIVLFGGNRVLFGTESDTATFLQDLWEWDGAHWRQLQVATPPPRAEASMVYDEARKRVVLFGGYHIANGKMIRFGDTWEWDGKQWSQSNANGPSPRNGAALIYDAARERIVLFGGSGASGETWALKDGKWHEIKPPLAEGRFNSVMAFDEKRKHVIRFGGWNGNERVGDTWRFANDTWQRLEVPGPEARNHSAMAYDSKRQRLVLFGGHEGEKVFGDTWEWDGSKWSRAAFHAPRMRVDNGH
ncbi:MAG: hypothetical protein AAB354_00010 [candidate division KSB1 bacterium]